MLLDELRELAKKSEFSGCAMGAWVSQQEKDVQELIASLAVNPNVNLSEVLSLLKKHDPTLPFKRTTFSLHMRGTCACHQS